MAILITIIAVGLILFFLFKPPTRKKYPVITEAMFEKPDEVITLALAKKYYRQVMLQIGYLDREEVGYHTDLFAEELKGEMESIKETIQEYKGNIAELSPNLKKLQTQLKNCTDSDEKEEIEAEIENIQDEIDDYQSAIDEGTEKLTALKTDKKQYLINALNQELQHNS